MIKKKEFIGKKAEIKKNNKTFIGKIIDETKNTIRLKTENKIITIIKENSKIKINGQEINGNDIRKRPEDRIKAC